MANLQFDFLIQNSIYDDYQSLMTQVKELVQKGDVVALKQACNTQVCHKFV